MGDLGRRPAGLTGQALGLHRARVFIGRHCALGPTLVMPTWLLWEAYERFGRDEGFDASSKDLRMLLDQSPWAEVVERPEARGRFKSIVRGVGMKSMVLPGASER